MSAGVFMNLVARKISDRRPVFANQSPICLSPGMDVSNYDAYTQRALTLSVDDGRVPESDPAICCVGEERTGLFHGGHIGDGTWSIEPSEAW